MSAKAMLLIAMAAFSIWFAHSREWFNCFLESSLSPAGGTRGTGSHHFSSCRWIVLRKEAEPSASAATMPWSTYQNSVEVKLSKISCYKRNIKASNIEWCHRNLLLSHERTRFNTHEKHVVKFAKSWKVNKNICPRPASHYLKNALY